MNSYKKEIPVEVIVANDGNPRKDFGDIAALAASMAANGGRPYTPIIVVPDGARFRLVDGERRWRAMRELGTKMCDALIFPDMADAEAAVAMMATDDSKSLSKQERMRGFQSMLALGVEDGAIAGVLGCDAATVGRVRRYARDLPEQATLDGLIAAADEEFSDEERARILEESERQWGDPEAVARRIRKAHEREARMAAIRDALPEGVELRPGEKPYRPEREGLYWVAKAANPRAAARLAAQHEGEEGLVAYEDGIGYAVYRTASEGALDPREAEMAKVARERDEHKEAYRAAYREMCLWATEPWWKDDPASRGRTPASRRPNVCDAVMAERTGGHGPYRTIFDEAGRSVLGVAAAYAEDEDPGCLEVSQWLLGKCYRRHGLYGWSGGTEVMPQNAHCFALVYDALLLDGWQPSEACQAIRAMCPDEEGDES